MNLRHPLKTLLVLVSTLALAMGCGGSGSGTEATVTVYSASGLGAWYATQFDKFTKATGIKVRLFEAGSGELVSRVNSRAVWQRLDGDRSVPEADLLVTLPPFIQRAAKAGLLQDSGADTTGIPVEALGPNGTFVPIVNTALCFIASPSANPQPSTWSDLLSSEFKGRLQYSTPGEAGDGTAVLLLLQHLMGKQGALDYLARLQPNTVGPASSTGGLQSKVNSGELLVANGDLQMNLASIKNDGSTFTIFFPAMPDGSRTTVGLPYVAGVTTASQAPEQAKKLLAFLLSDEVQQSVHSQAFGIPVRESIAKAAAEDNGALTPAGLLKGVTLWSPDWDAVLADLERDIAAYKAATGT